MLDLSSNQVTEIAPLVGLDRLRYLNLNRNRIADTAPLQSLTNLEQVYLYNNPVNITPCPSANTLCLI